MNIYCSTSGEKWLDSGYTLKVGQIGIADRLCDEKELRKTPKF